MTKQEAIEVLNGLKERLAGVPDSYDSETDIRAIEIAVESIKESIRLDEFLRPWIKKGERII